MIDRSQKCRFRRNLNAENRLKHAWGPFQILSQFSTLIGWQDVSGILIGLEKGDIRAVPRSNAFRWCNISNIRQAMHDKHPKKQVSDWLFHPGQSDRSIPVARFVTAREGPFDE